MAACPPCQCSHRLPLVFVWLFFYLRAFHSHLLGLCHILILFLPVFCSPLTLWLILMLLFGSYCPPSTTSASRAEEIEGKPVFHSSPCLFTALAPRPAPSWCCLVFSASFQPGGPQERCWRKYPTLGSVAVLAGAAIEQTGGGGGGGGTNRRGAVGLLSPVVVTEAASWRLCRPVVAWLELWLDSAAEEEVLPRSVKCGETESSPARSQ